MSIDKLQEKIRKLKCPLAVDFTVLPEHIPSQIMESEGDFLSAYRLFCKELLKGLKDTIPAIRFNAAWFTGFGIDGMYLLQELLSYGKSLGYYILLDWAELLSPISVTSVAENLFDENNTWQFDGLIVTAYTGSDAIRPYAEKLKDSGKDLFVVAKTSNKTGAEIQDMLSGARHIHIAVTELANRFSGSLVGKSGYSQIAVVAAASAADSLKTLRTKFKNTFLLLDGCDYPNANAKNCSHAFDGLGHGAIACAGTYVTAAWQEEYEPAEYVDCAIRYAERMKKNLCRYITIL